MKNIIFQKKLNLYVFDSIREFQTYNKNILSSLFRHKYDFQWFYKTYSSFLPVLENTNKEKEFFDSINKGNMDDKCFNEISLMVENKAYEINENFDKLFFEIDNLKR